MSCSRLRSQCNVFPALHQISLLGNIFGVLILDMGEGRGENFVLKLKSDVHSTRITFDLFFFNIYFRLDHLKGKVYSLIDTSFNFFCSSDYLF